jgi:hypothetical protein
VDESRKRAMRTVRSVLILFYFLLLIGSAWFGWRQVIAAESFYIFLGVIVLAVLLVLIVIAYLASLLIAGVVYNLKVPMWVVVLSALIAGPAAVAGYFIALNAMT